MNKSEIDYLKQGKKPLSTQSSILISSSKYLNSPRLRELFAAEGLKRTGSDLPDAFLVPEAIQAFGEIVDPSEMLDHIAAEKLRNPEFATWLSKRHISNIQAEDLKNCTPGTLGAAVHEFITTSGFDIDFMFRAAPTNDLEYLMKRLAQGHDIEHMVTGLDTDPMGENGLMVANAQSWCNYFGTAMGGAMSRFNFFLISTGLMRTSLHYPAVLPTFLDAIRIGTEMGHQIKRPLFMENWEDYWEWSIPQIREELHIVGSPEKGAWSWTWEASRG